MDTRLKLREGEGKTKFYWSEETLTHFKLRMFAELGLTKEVTEFVEECCDLEDGEEVADLVVDLIQQVFTK